MPLPDLEIPTATLSTKKPIQLCSRGICREASDQQWRTGFSIANWHRSIADGCERDEIFDQEYTAAIRIRPSNSRQSCQILHAIRRQIRPSDAGTAHVPRHCTHSKTTERFSSSYAPNSELIYFSRFHTERRKSCREPPAVCLGRNPLPTWRLGYSPITETTGRDHRTDTHGIATT